MKIKTSCELRARRAIARAKGEGTYEEYKYRFDRLAKLVGRFAASPSSSLERLTYTYTYTYIYTHTYGSYGLYFMKICRIVMYKWQEAVNGNVNDRCRNWMI